MKLIVGLGNPGKKYENTWHNIGFMAIDALAKFCVAPKSKKSGKFKAEISEAFLGEEKIILAKPLTFMNLSGEAVSALAGFYKLSPADIIVIHDDIDLPLGKIRIAFDSSAGGHNGIKSIIQSLKTQKFCRLKLGVAEKNLELMDAADYVLASIGKKAETTVKRQLEVATEAIIRIIKTSPEKAMNEYN